uniref:Disease resistance N-terminal domain-containing protein n=1 Tax=Oryza rufipogon TaxID=4529 RepID=A0A0E0NEU8_ORYRU
MVLGLEWKLEATIAMTALVLTELHRMRDKKKASDTLAEDVAFIKKDLEFMESFLADAADAEKRSHTHHTTTTTTPSKSLRTWLRHIRGLTGTDVEDYLQEFCLHAEKPPRAKSKLLLPLDTITKQISRLRKEIEHVNKTSGIYCNALNFGPDAAQPMI